LSILEATGPHRRRWPNAGAVGTEAAGNVRVLVVFLSGIKEGGDVRYQPNQSPKRNAV